MEFEYIDLVDTVDRLKDLCGKLKLNDILEGSAKQIDIISEIKERIESIEIERIDSIDFNIPEYTA